MRSLFQGNLPFEHELVVDLFAGGGGASEAMKGELGREPDIAINHDKWAIAMHEANHPTTKHYQEDIYDVDPVVATSGKPVGLLHASPDCTHHSQAKGGQPRSKEVRSLSWVVHKWAGKIKPRCITLENVEQIQKWCPLIAKRDPNTGRVITLDIVVDAKGRKTNRVADPGERVPVRRQFLIPDPKRTGETWNRWLRGLAKMGYAYMVGKLASHEYGGGTSRERLFFIARRDGLPIVWPKATHGKGKGLKSIVSAADSIDWSIKCPSIFTRKEQGKKELVAATLRRVAKGAVKHVLECADPFIVPVTHTGSDRVHPSSEPIRTITTAQRGEFMVCAPSLVSVAHGDSGGRREYPIADPLGTQSGANTHALVVPTLIQTSFGERKGQSPRVPGLGKPVGTIVAGGIKHAVVSAFLEQAHEELPGRDARDSLSTIVGKGCTQRVIAASLATLRNNMVGTDGHDPLRSIAAGGEHHAVVEYSLSPEAEEGALRVAAFLIRYYGDGGQWGDLRKPLHTMTTKERLALVTVTIRGTPYVIVDIGLRMLTPRELFRAQGFPDSYIIDTTADGRPISKTHQVRMVGNSVSPPPYKALLRANFQHERLYQAAA